MPSRFDNPELIEAQILESRERGENWKIRNAVLRGELLERTEVLKVFENITLAIKQLIEGSNLTDREKQGILMNLSQIPERILVVAKNQEHAEEQTTETIAQNGN